MSIKYLWNSILWEIKFLLQSFHMIIMLFFFAISLTVIYHYSLNNEVFLEKNNYYGLFILSVFFMIILLSGRGLQREKEGGIYKIILMSPIPRWIYYLSKIISKTIVILFTIIVYQFIYKILLIGQIFFYENDVVIMFLLIPCIINLLAIGEIVSLMSSGNRMRELILPALFFPLSIPIFIVYSSTIRNIIETKIEMNFTLIEFFILPLILAIIYVLIGILFFSHLSVEES